MTIGERIKQLRKEHGLTQKDLAERCGYSSLTTINKIELGINSVPISVVEKIARVFGVSPSYLMGWENEYNEKNLMRYDNISPISVQKIPMLGEISCGKPLFANEERDSYVLAGTQIKADFCLTCKGDSMINAGIYEGSIVFCKKQEIVENGEIAAVIINDEATLKRFYYYPEQAKLVLQAENPKYAPLVYIKEELNEITVLGKAVAYQNDIK